MCQNLRNPIHDLAAGHIKAALKIAFLGHKFQKISPKNFQGEQSALRGGGQFFGRGGTRVKPSFGNWSSQIFPTVAEVATD